MTKTRKKKKEIAAPPSFNLADYGLGPNSKFDPKFIIDGQRLAIIGVSQRSMAGLWGVSEDSITRWKESIPAFADAIKKGESERNVRLLSALFTMATEKNNVAAAIFLAKNWLEMRDYFDQSISSAKPLKIEIIQAEKKSPENK